MRTGFVILALSGFVSACTVTPVHQDAHAENLNRQAEAAAASFVQVVEQVEPVAESICRRQNPATNCDFQIVVDTRKNQPPNAFQTQDEAGRPILALTVSLIADVRNQDELAFVLGHEAAHHIAGHLDRTQDTIIAGVVLGGLLAEMAGADPAMISSAQDVGAMVGARTFSKDFELEADSLGTVIAYRAGYDPEVGARYFTRVADPGDQFLGTHPPNAARIETVRQTLAQLK